MSQSLEPIFRAATVADFSPEWIASVRDGLKRDGQATRPGSLHGKTQNGTTGYLYSPNPIIEAQSINTGDWQPINLPTNATHFATEADRDTVLELLVGKEKK